MNISNVKIVDFRGDEKDGYNRDGEYYRGRTVEISWPDDDNKRTHHVIARFRTQPCEMVEQKGLKVGDVISVDATFDLSQGRAGYRFTNCYINKIL